MAEYKILKISQQEPRKWHNDKFNSDTFYIKCMLEGHSRAVEIGKRSPDALKPGDIVSGTILDKPEFDADGFKPAPMAFGGGSSAPASAGKPAYQPKDEHAIAKAVALKAAVEINTSGVYSDVLRVAEHFLEWLEGSAEPAKSEPTTEYDKDFGPPPAKDEFGKDEIDLSTIPF